MFPKFIFYSGLILLQICSAQQNFEVGIPAQQNVQIAGDNDQCAAFCVQTYPPHTLENSELAKSCKQGCRLYSMLQFVVDRNNESAIRETCTADCFEAYHEDTLRKSCADGCQHQTLYNSGALQVQMDNSSPLFGKAVDSMMNQMSSFQKQVADRFQGAKDWFNMDMPKFEDINRDVNDRFRNMFDQLEKSFNMEDGDSGNPLFNYADQLFGRKQPDLQTSSPKSVGSSEEAGIAHSRPVFKLGDQFKGPTVGNEDQNNEPIIIVHMIGNQNPPRQEPSNPSGDDDHSDEDSTMLKETANEPSPPIDMSGDPDDDWLSCLARRARRLSMITRWMLCIALMLSIASMIWICLAIMRTAPRRRLLMANMKKTPYEVIYSTPPVTASDKLPMIIETKEPLPESESPPPPYEVAPIHGKGTPVV